ncbi:MAG TPA: o-succinylbenzoate--CoA ligase [Kiritimatiellia bacterium]|nr:o-succinylbenzoate--CoA ligase [Kiritimatiellia bacterium]
MTTIRCIIDEAACISRHQPGIIQGDKVLLYSEWNDLAGAVADRLKKVGVNSGDRVAVFLATDWRTLVLITGIMRSGAVVCPISTRLPRTVVLEQLRELSCNRIVAHVSEASKSEMSGIEVISPDMLLETPESAATAVPRFENNDPCMILFTSGSGGNPKPAVLSYGNLYYNAQGANANIRVHSNDRWLLNLPIYHVSGIGVIFRCIMSGAAILIPAANESLADSISKYKPSLVSIVPAQLADLLRQAGETSFNSVRVFLVGGSSADPEMLQEASQIGLPVYMTYGMTEMASQITTMPSDAPPSRRFTTSGRILRHRQLKVDEDGLIHVKGPCLFPGYLKDGKLVRKLDQDGWFATGDLGTLSDDGYLTVLGRKDHLIISGGENIQPEEVEQELLGIDGITCAVVVPVPHKKFGQRPVAFVRSEKLDDKTWRRHLLNRLPSFKVPDAFYSLPDDLEASGLKIPRKKLAEIAMKLHGH